MKEEEIKDTLSRFKTVAIVGISPKPDRPSYVVAAYLQSKGYRIIPVRPDGEEILGEKVYHSLMEIPKRSKSTLLTSSGSPRMFRLLRRRRSGRGAKVVWMQEGITNQEACEKPKRRG